LPGVKYSIYFYSEHGRIDGMSEKIGSRIRALRLEKKLTLDQLAEKAGLSKSYLWELENKDPPRPSAEKLGGIAKALEVTVDYLMGSDTPEELQTAEDRAFFREYQRMSPPLKATLRQMRKLLDEKK
jgi:transcriptional regulator with XRE-family HTH domain